MKQYEPCIQNNNNNNNNTNKKIEIKTKKNIEKSNGCGIEESVLREIFFFLFFSFSYLRKSDCRISSEQEPKFIQASRATRGYQNLGVS